MSEKLNVIEGRLRGVEQAVVRIEGKLDNIPTKTELWRAGAKVAIATIVAVGGGLLWVVQKYLEPILAKLSGV